MKFWPSLQFRSRSLHRYLTLLIGVQILIWTFSGLVMSFFPIDKVRSEHHFLEPEPSPLSLRTIDQQTDTARRILPRLTSTPLGIEFVHLLDTPVMKVKFANGKHTLIAAENGEILTPLNKTWASRIAQAHYKGESQLRSVQLQKEMKGEYRKEVPVWRVEFENDEDTTYYISPETGNVLARRSKLWRFYDFFWMLHIMDYWNRTNFNSWWLIAAATLGVLATTSGLFVSRIYIKRRPSKY